MEVTATELCITTLESNSTEVLTNLSVSKKEFDILDLLIRLRSRKSNTQNHSTVTDLAKFLG